MARCSADRGANGPSLIEILADICAVEENETLERKGNFVGRAEAIDLVEFHVIDRIDCALRSGPAEDLVRLKQRAEALRDRLEAINAALLEEFRARIRCGAWTGTELRSLLRQYGESVCRPPEPGRVVYDALDAFVCGLVFAGDAPTETRRRGDDEVYLQPTPARIILELVERAAVAPADVFYDLGSGLGQVPIMVSLLTGASARGVEIEPAYCDYARRCAAALNLDRVEFVHSDARDADYSDGTCFFMYTPFVGRLLHQVLERLRDESLARCIRLCTYGPCTPKVAGQDWLRFRGQVVTSTHELAVFESIARGHSDPPPGSP